MGKVREPKAQSERIKESLRLVNQLIDIGVAPDAPSMKVLRDHMNDWIRTGDDWMGVIPFPSYGRDAEVVLPYRADRAASINFKIVK